jgi:hypothetical protein
MKTLTFENRDEWLSARRGKITGTRLKDIIVKRGTEKKIGFFEVLAERLSTDPYGEAIAETPMERGTRLEPEAIGKWEEDKNVEVDKSLVMWVRDENESIAISPDGFIGDTVAVESKCLSSARHIEAYVKKFIWGRSDWEAVPDDYKEQDIQYFIVNDKLETLYMVFYDPRVTAKEYFCLTIKRADVQEEIEKYLEQEIKTILELDEIVNKITF